MTGKRSCRTSPSPVRTAIALRSDFPTLPPLHGPVGRPSSIKWRAHRRQNSGWSRYGSGPRDQRRRADASSKFVAIGVRELVCFWFADDPEIDRCQSMLWRSSAEKNQIVHQNAAQWWREDRTEERAADHQPAGEYRDTSAEHGEVKKTQRHAKASRAD